MIEVLIKMFTSSLTECAGAAEGGGSDDIHDGCSCTGDIGSVLSADGGSRSRGR